MIVSTGSLAVERSPPAHEMNVVKDAARHSAPPALTSQATQSVPAQFPASGASQTAALLVITPLHLLRPYRSRCRPSTKHINYIARVMAHKATFPSMNNVQVWKVPRSIPALCLVIQFASAASLRHAESDALNLDSRVLECLQVHTS